MLDSTKTSPAAIEIAARLAGAFGHEWGWLAPDAARAAFEVGGIELIKAMTVAHRADWSMTGIDAPFAVEGGALTHTTATGRVRWDIASSGGEVVITISRPSGAVIQIQMMFGPTFGAEVVSVETLGAFGERHVTAALEAVRAAAPPRGVPPAVSGGEWTDLAEKLVGEVREYLAPGQSECPPAADEVSC